MTTPAAPRTNARNTWIVDCVLLFLLMALLIWPLFRLKYSDIWSSIESTFIADARMLNTPGTEAQWQPVWYCGTRSIYLYPPALRYGTAWIARTFSLTTARSYHLYTAILYALGAIAVYLLIRIGNGSRKWAWIGTAGVMLCSPIFLLFPEYRIDSGHLVPQRLQVLVRYGEGPHISSLSLLPFAFAAMFLAARSRRLFWISLCAIASALVVANNFYGATALAILFPLILWAFYVVDRRIDVIVKGAAVAILSYLLCAFWLVPSYIQVTRDNLKLVAEPGNTWSLYVFAVAVAAYILLTLRIRFADPYRIWVFSALFFMSLYILGHRWFGFQIAGQSARLAPELDFVIILAAVEVARWCYTKQRNLTIAVIFIAFLPSVKYVKHAWEIYRPDLGWQNSVEHKTADWVTQNYPHDRAYVIGSVRFWFDTWHDNRQLDGGSMQGILNPLIPAATYCLSECTEAWRISAWMRATGTDLAVISEKNSKEVYHDVRHPEVWRANFPVTHDDGEGNIAYRFPRRTPGVVRLVNDSLIKLPQMTLINQPPYIAPYADAVEALPAGGPDTNRIHVERKSSDEFSHIDVNVAPGEALLVQESFDAQWHMYENRDGREVRLPIQKDPIGFMFVPLVAGEHHLRLVFDTPTEVIVGRVLFWVGVLAVLLSFGEAFLRQRGSPEPGDRSQELSASPI